MPSWLDQAVSTSANVSPGVLAVRLVLAFVLGYTVSVIYRKTHSGEPYTPTFPVTLALLCVLIAAVTQVVGDSVARAFSLVGALSIVRFRTVVQDTRDTAFVIFAVIVGMAMGAGHLWIALLTLAVAGVAAALMRPADAATAPPASDDWFKLTLRLQLGAKPAEILSQVREGRIIEAQTVSVATARQGATLDAVYSLRLTSEAVIADLVDALNNLDGVLGVDLRQG